MEFTHLEVLVPLALPMSGSGYLHRFLPEALVCGCGWHRAGNSSPSATISPTPSSKNSKLLTLKSARIWPQPSFIGQQNLVLLVALKSPQLGPGFSLA